jgi:hypothetical protein
MFFDRNNNDNSIIVVVVVLDQAQPNSGHMPTHQKSGLNIAL